MFEDLDYLAPAGGKTQKAAKKEREKFPCQSCGGSGSYRGVRVHQEATECFPCGGRGFFYSSHADRLKRRAEAAARKRSKLETAKEVFNKENPGFIEILSDMAKWADIARDMYNQYSERGALTVNQVAVILRMKEKADATRAAKQAERDEKKSAINGKVDLSSIHAMFDKAKANGLKKLAYRADGLILSPAKATSANFGAIYVKRNNGDYLGKVVGTEFKATWDAKPEDKETLNRIAENPAEVAKAYGIRTGICSCCGRELTDPESIAAGIGPICATKWEF
ncbi:hypothetical protein EV128_12210 [Rhizobium azibense]|nr:hypothetical protein EV128_12210 [Rhizobium azibense]